MSTENHKKGPRLLLTDREAGVLLERARVRCEGNRLVYDQAEDGTRKVFNIPYCNVSVLFLGQGTSITQDAMRLLGEEGVFVAFTGTGGAPLHMGALTTYQPSEHLRMFAHICLDDAQRLTAAKKLLLLRLSAFEKIGMKISTTLDESFSEQSEDIKDLHKDFTQNILSSKNTQELLSKEALYAKRLYKIFATKSSLTEKFVREHSRRKRITQSDIINSRIDHGNYLAYGFAGAALWVMGIPMSFAILHGKTRAGGLIFDLADIYKDSFVLPHAFLSKEHKESDFREVLINDFQDHNIIKYSINSIKTIISHTISEKEKIVK